MAILVFIVDYFQEKLITKFFKTFKKSYFGDILTFLPKIWAKMNLLEKRALSFFKYYNYLPLCHKSEKTIVLFVRKMLDWQMNGQTGGRTDRQLWFCRTLCEWGVQLLKQVFLNLYQNTKNQFVPLISLRDTANFRFLQPEWTHPPITTPIPTFLNQLFISMNLYQYAKNQTISSLCSGYIVDLKTLQSHWPVTFWYFF